MTPKTAGTYEVPSASLSASMGGGGSDDPHNQGTSEIDVHAGTTPNDFALGDHGELLSRRHARTLVAGCDNI